MSQLNSLPYDSNSSLVSIDIQLIICSWDPSGHKGNHILCSESILTLRVALVLKQFNPLDGDSPMCTKLPSIWWCERTSGAHALTLSVTYHWALWISVWKWVNYSALGLVETKTSGWKVSVAVRSGLYKWLFSYGYFESMMLHCIAIIQMHPSQKSMNVDTKGDGSHVYWMVLFQFVNQNGLTHWCLNNMAATQQTTISIIFF